MMDPKRARELLGGYATGSLSESERQTLLEAALHDQELFDEVMREDELRALLDVHGVKAELLRELEPRETVWTRFWSWMRTPAGWSAAGALATTAVLLVVIGVPRERRASVPAVAEMKREAPVETQAQAAPEKRPEGQVAQSRDSVSPKKSRVERAVTPPPPAPSTVAPPPPALASPPVTTPPAAAPPKEAERRVTLERDEQKLAKAEPKTAPAPQPVQPESARQDAAAAPPLARPKPSTATAEQVTVGELSAGRTFELRQTGDDLAVISSQDGSLSAYPTSTSQARGPALATLTLQKGVVARIPWGSAERLLLVFEPSQMEASAKQSSFRPRLSTGVAGMRAKTVTPQQPQRIELADAPVRANVAPGVVSIEVIRKR